MAIIMNEDDDRAMMNLNRQWPKTNNKPGAVDADDGW
ncbi:hypothetical protein DERF_008921 [Dermatophagoides farinae]|uniref:Uncharacterized protein n=1 Tax=Dermatophagoides farinae TaxID=6954 RepID=A0A922I2M6_DERFA|nr:hypothetical protein DERF_008921 [Dermatophagoides farinae]